MRDILAGNGGFLPILHLLNLHLGRPDGGRNRPATGARFAPPGPDLHGKGPIDGGAKGPLRRPCEKIENLSWVRINAILKSFLNRI